MEAAAAPAAAPMRRPKRRGSGWKAAPKKKSSQPNGPGPGRPRKEKLPAAPLPYHSKHALTLMLLSDEWEPFLRADTVCATPPLLTRWN